MKMFFAAVALSAALVGISAGSAEARCWWSGYGWHCWHPGPLYGYRHWYGGYYRHHWGWQRWHGGWGRQYGYRHW